MTVNQRAVDAFMERLGPDAVTFDDVSLVPRYADFLPKETDISSRLTTRINVTIPFISAAMDTVTESRMAIAMAMLGGIGIIHKNIGIAQQAREVEVVKHHLNGLIRTPITFRAGDTLQTVRETKAKKGYAFSGFPVLDETNRLAGILTSADMKFARDPQIRVADMMTTQVVTGRPNTTLT
ncbi:MAG: IMP dehydrogenase, partial [Lentisphaerae bacterium]|nr:IMP dehydrogenase [Lentisphaerota bacterium]